MRIDLGGMAIVTWAVGGNLAILARAIHGLAPRAVEALQHPLGAVEWAALAAWVVFCAWAEGYRGFQTRFSPRLVGRALYLARHPRPLAVVLAPAHAIGLFDATPRRLAGSWGLVLGITALVLLVRLLDQPWRGIVDAGVVVGLTWGGLSILWLTLLALRGRDPVVPLDLR